MSERPADHTADIDPLLSTKKIAALFDVTPETVRDWIEQGKLEGAVKINRSWRVPKSKVMAFARQRHGE
jgi:excisionase family DNA binding protein